MFSKCPKFRSLKITNGQFLQSLNDHIAKHHHHYLHNDDNDDDDNDGDDDDDDEQVVQEYERAVIFRLGRLRPGGAKGPGGFHITIIIFSATIVAIIIIIITTTVVVLIIIVSVMAFLVSIPLHLRDWALSLCHLKTISNFHMASYFHGYTG